MPAEEDQLQGVSSGQRQAFRELQMKFFSNSSQLKQIAQQLQNTIKTGRKAALTLEQLNSMDDVSRTYVALGKMYVLTPKEDVQEQLAATDTQAVEERKKLLDRKEVVEKQLNDTEKELRELLQQSPALAQAIATNSA